VVPRADERERRGGDRSHPGCERDGPVTAFKFGHGPFEGVHGRIAEPTVEIARLLVIVDRDALVRVRKRKYRCRIDRNRKSTVIRGSVLASVHGLREEGMFVHKSYGNVKPTDV
jgi:hypothetical protein